MPVKCAAVFAGSAVPLIVGRPSVSALALACSLLLVWWGIPGKRRAGDGARVRRAWSIPLPLLVMVGAMGAYQRLLGMPERTVVYVCGVLTALYLARFFTATTSDSQMLDTCARFAAPAGRLGANPEAIALAAAIMVRSIPHIVHLMANARKAARARHLRARYMPRVLVPVVIAAIGYALSTHDALRARNLESSERAPA